MAITVKYLEGLGIDKEIADKIFAERGKEIENEKLRREELETKLSEKENELNIISTELEKLKNDGADAEEWQKKYEDLSAEIKEKEKKAEADRKAKEKEDAISSRFEAVASGKEFNHDAIKADYRAKFAEALESEDYTGKSDADIFHELTKDDAAAFKNVTAFNLPGGTNKNIGGGSADDLGKMSMVDYIAARKEMKG